MSIESGTVLNLFIKKKRGTPMLGVTELILRIGYGIEGDINANPISPRQILILRYEDILEFSIPPGELRENIVLANIEPEHFLPGSTICFDSGAVIRLTFYCEPCKRIVHLVDSLKSIENKRGLLGVVITEGKVQVGNKFKIEANKFPPLPENSYQRFLYFVAKIPEGKVVTYEEIISGMGVTNSYMRAIPTYLKKTAADKYPIHRILNSKGHLIQHIHKQKETLESENIEVLCKVDMFGNSNIFYVDIHKYIWEDNTIYIT